MLIHVNNKLIQVAGCNSVCVDICVGIVALHGLDRISWTNLIIQSSDGVVT